MVQPSGRENKGDFVNDWKQKETRTPTERRVKSGDTREAASIRPAALFTLHSQLFTLTELFPRKKAALTGGLFVLDLADYLYISGFSMVSTFRN